MESGEPAGASAMESDGSHAFRSGPGIALGARLLEPGVLPENGLLLTEEADAVLRLLAQRGEHGVGIVAQRLIEPEHASGSEPRDDGHHPHADAKPPRPRGSALGIHESQAGSMKLSR